MSKKTNVELKKEIESFEEFIKQRKANGEKQCKELVYPVYINDLRRHFELQVGYTTEEEWEQTYDCDYSYVVTKAIQRMSQRELRRNNFVNGKLEDRGVGEFQRRNLALVQEEESEFEIDDEIVNYLKNEKAHLANEHYKLFTLTKNNERKQKNLARLLHNALFGDLHQSYKNHKRDRGEKVDFGYDRDNEQNNDEHGGATNSTFKKRKSRK